MLAVSHGRNKLLTLFLKKKKKKCPVYDTTVSDEVPILVLSRVYPCNSITL